MVIDFAMFFLHRMNLSISGCRLPQFRLIVLIVFLLPDQSSKEFPLNGFLAKSQQDSDSICTNMILDFFGMDLLHLLEIFSLHERGSNFYFFVADTQLYKRLCPSVGPFSPLVRGDRIEK